MLENKTAAACHSRNPMLEDDELQKECKTASSLAWRPCGEPGILICCCGCWAWVFNKHCSIKL